MTLRQSKEWFRKRIAQERKEEIGAGSPVSEHEKLIAEARALCEAATPGPWEAIPEDGRGGYRVLAPPEGGGRRVQLTEWASVDNAALIACARTLIPELVEALKAARAYLDDPCPTYVDQLAVAREQARTASATEREACADLVDDAAIAAGGSAKIHLIARAIRQRGAP